MDGERDQELSLTLSLEYKVCHKSVKERRAKYLDIINGLHPLVYMCFITITTKLLLIKTLFMNKSCNTCLGF